MADFFKCYNKLIKIEGGYANDTDDRGKETYRGVSRKSFPAWAGWVRVDAAKSKPGFPLSLDSNAALQAAVVVFYRLNFWNIQRLDEVENNNIALELFDTAVNMGNKPAAQIIQRALNVLNRQGKDYPDTRLDGNIGPATVALVNNFKNPRLLYDVMNTLQGARYVQICEADPTQERFMHGWLTRVYE